MIFDAKQHAARHVLLLRGLYGLLAVDALLVMSEHGGRYGVRGFNVAHFAWIDTWLPTPTPGLYVGAVTLCSFLALAAAVSDMTAAVRVTLALVYLLTWTVSLQDSYQHHYLLSWLLAYAVCFPRIGALSVKARAPQPRAALTSALGFPLTALTCATVYFYTGVSKLEPSFRSGAVLQHLLGGRRSEWLMQSLSFLNVNPNDLWGPLAASLVMLQWTVALAYVVSVTRDEKPRAWKTVVCTLGFVASVGFHAVAELSGVFSIGLFSYYMLWIAWCLLVPASSCALFVRALDLPVHALLRSRLVLAVCAYSRRHVLLALLVSVGALLGAAKAADLPGVFVAALLFCLVLLTPVSIRPAPMARRFASRAAPAFAASATMLMVAVSATTWRFDYYRRSAGELSNMGEYGAALDAYEKAELYAPAGRSRRTKIEALRRRLRASGAEKSSLQ